MNIIHKCKACDPKLQSVSNCRKYKVIHYYKACDPQVQSVWFASTVCDPQKYSVSNCHKYKAWDPQP